MTTTWFSEYSSPFRNAWHYRRLCKVLSCMGRIYSGHFFYDSSGEEVSQVPYWNRIFPLLHSFIMWCVMWGFHQSGPVMFLEWSHGCGLGHGHSWVSKETLLDVSEECIFVPVYVGSKSPFFNYQKHLISSCILHENCLILLHMCKTDSCTFFCIMFALNYCYIRIGIRKWVLFSSRV